MLKKIKTGLTKSLLAVCTVILVTVTVFALMQVCGRYIFLHTFFWVEEITAILLGWLVACGVPMVWLQGEHIAMDAIDALLPVKVREAWGCVIQLMGILMGGVCLYSGVRAVRQNMGFSISMRRYDESIRFLFVPTMGALLIVSACLLLAERYQAKKEGKA